MIFGWGVCRTESTPHCKRVGYGYRGPRIRYVGKAPISEHVLVDSVDKFSYMSRFWSLDSVNGVIAYIR